MTLSCGVNDVWHGKRGVPLDQYKTNITDIVDKCQAAGVRVMILTATMIREDPAGDLNRQLAPYNEFLRELAEEEAIRVFADNLNDLLLAAPAGPRQPGKPRCPAYVPSPPCCSCCASAPARSAPTCGTAS